MNIIIIISFDFHFQLIHHCIARIQHVSEQVYIIIIILNSENINRENTILKSLIHTLLYYIISLKSNYGHSVYFSIQHYRSRIVDIPILTIISLLDINNFV